MREMVHSGLFEGSPHFIKSVAKHAELTSRIAQSKAVLWRRWKQNSEDDTLSGLPRSKLEVSVDVISFRIEG